MAVHAPSRSAEASQSAEPTDLPTITFVQPMPGFPDQRNFALVRLDENGLLYALTSVEDPKLRFLVVPPGPFFEGYAPEVDDETLELLGKPDADQLLTLLVVTAAEASTTANLLAPIIIDQGERRAVQVILTGSGMPVRAPFGVAG
jgi:flagellar assembly factor FliW